jgi:hypothetical protein
MAPWFGEHSSHCSLVFVWQTAARGELGISLVALTLLATYSLAAEGSKLNWSAGPGRPYEMERPVKEECAINDLSTNQHCAGRRGFGGGPEFLLSA